MTHTHPHRHKPWYEDRPIKIALVSGFFSTLMTMMNIIFSSK